MKAICLTVWNRPDSLRTLLNSLRQVRRLADWCLFVRIEPSEKQNLLAGILLDSELPCPLQLKRNSFRLGVRQNPLACLHDAAKAKAEAFLLLEDDLELSSDCLEFIELALSTPHWDETYRCGNLHFSTVFNQAHLQEWPNGEPTIASIGLQTFFLSSLGLFFSRYQFASFISKHWNDEPLQIRSFKGERVSGWDCALKQALLLGTRPCLQSLLPRVRHLGIEGEHSDAALHQEGHAHAGLWEGRHSLEHLTIHSLDSINTSPPEGSAWWGHLLRMAHQLWCLEQATVMRQQELSRCRRQLQQCLISTHD